ncbi:uncharacterized protein C8Q71DRAFT_11880 [Rhodofomes roseus]|uniref:PB1 domain-containing protein n=1 Tax=Rhodofomes roseus TaxID=34475 RepID=A0ABQ8KXF3_9APHY|nr:uncharacterized protein C8Q71DRAFT_11880 [Rhodofomes roseus]KAH9843733.1 hypothetical protein C8Q71DRAFT_11880 [Rhodofomes roseus]
MKPQYNVKLTFDKTTRKLPFASQPTWVQLASRIESLYRIPAHAAAVKYTDDDGDEVTISTEEELQDYYEALGTDAVIIKLVVCKLQDAPKSTAGDGDDARKGHRKDLQQEGEPSDSDESADQGSDRGSGSVPAPQLKGFTHKSKAETAHGHGTHKSPPTTIAPPEQDATKRGGKRPKGRKGGRQVSPPATDYVVPANRTRGDRHQASPPSRNRGMEQPISSARGHHHHHKEHDDVDDDADDDSDGDDADDDDDEGKNKGNSFTLEVDVNGNSTSSSDSGSDDDEADNNPGFGNDFGHRRRGEKRGRHNNRNSQQDFSAPFGGQDLGSWPNNNFAPQPPSWDPFTNGSFGGSFSFSGQGHGHNSHARGSSRGGGEPNSPFGGFNFGTWQPQPTPLTEMMASLNSWRR